MDEKLLNKLIIEKYEKVFTTDGEIKICGREACKELIKACQKKHPNMDFGNTETGMMNIVNIKNVYEIEKKGWKLK